MADLFTEEWCAHFGQTLNDDVKWQVAAKWFQARVQFEAPDSAFSIDISNGKVVDVTVGKHPHGAEIYLAAPAAEWQSILDGSSNWLKGISPGLGEIDLGGDSILAMRNMNAMYLLIEAAKRVDRKVVVRPEPSPEPQPSGNETTGHYIVVNGIRTYYEEAGEGPAIVCFHAACQDTLMYRHVLDGLSDHYRVIALDAPGHCKSLMPADGPFTDMTQHAEFNEAFMDALGIANPVIIGCSMAGNEVLELGARRPGAYAGIVSSEGADYTPTVSDLSLDMIKVDGQQYVGAWSRSLIGNRTPQNREDEVEWQLRRNVPEVMAGDLTGYGHFDKRDAMNQITAPVLLLRGDADWLVSQEAVEATAARIANARIAVLPGTGHYPMSENPYEFNETVRAFLHEIDYR
jgi:pimeloyl-ACP methyl ester carboxylesterase/putative sterol carrier protein